MALVARQSSLLDPLRAFVAEKKPVWGTCAGMILLAAEANRTKRGGQELIGGLDIRIVRNQYGRQIESFQEELDVTVFQRGGEEEEKRPFPGVFIRAPIVHSLLRDLKDALLRDSKDEKELGLLQTAPVQVKGESGEVHIVDANGPGDDQDAIYRAVESGRQEKESSQGATEAAVNVNEMRPPLQVLARLPKALLHAEEAPDSDVVALRQGNVMATSFHPELTTDSRFHHYFIDTIVQPYLEIARQ